ncbi:DNA-directed RNA polymerase III subunit RPC7 isoform X2 [Myiozetetes cayanensis]|uniref:DNA-directed RNA polymerase III subunit RPC7 isoform X2 n=1 Tax=Myiozetetes cayanensis TaxID=478635 RepID=UPI00215FADA5|nr:DNA-directed RNA polymerase III subunit RPC7 isoform X2 [Myiozetetes cayanensis]
MAGSGRGRGRASFTFNIEAIGFGKGAALPDVICKPPPPFPSTDNKPVPLKTGEDEDYMLALKQDLRETMKRMPYFLTVEEEHQAIERYSQKYQDSEKEQNTWTPDWRRLPREMKPKKTTKKAFFCRIVNQILQQQLELVLAVLTGKKILLHSIICFSKCFLVCMIYLKFSIKVCCSDDVK